MAVRVKLRISVKGSEKSCETVALVNSGFETVTPQLLIPRGLAEELAIWPGMLPKAKIVAYGTAGGVVRNYLIPNIVEVSIAEEDVQTKCTADLVISEIEEEVLISDKLAGRLGIVLEDVGEGLYSLKADPSRRIRSSYPPQYW
ncbi:MAG: hypothetical protein QXI35_08460 [Candidatus Nezhaarchaeales archaeon]